GRECREEGIDQRRSATIPRRQRGGQQQGAGANQNEQTEHEELRVPANARDLGDRRILGYFDDLRTWRSPPDDRLARRPGFAHEPSPSLAASTKSSMSSSGPASTRPSPAAI